MTREEKLYSMRGAELIAEAEKLGVKVSHKGNALKESKEKAIQKILAAEAVQNEEPEVEPVETVQEPENVSRETIEEPAVDAVETVPETEEKPKKERKSRQKKENPDRVVFTDRVVKLLEAAGYAVKVWDKIPNLFAVKNGKHTVAEVRTGLKGWTLNTKKEIADTFIQDYYTQNYFLPATAKLSYADFSIFEDFVNAIM